MADQKSRGGQKQGIEKQDQGKKNRDVRAGKDTGQQGQRDRGEDAQKGQQGRAGGYDQQDQGGQDT